MISQNTASSSDQSVAFNFYSYLNDILTPYGLKEEAKMVVISRALSNFFLKMGNILEKQEIAVTQILPDQKSLENFDFEQLFAAHPEIEASINDYLENEFTDLIAQAIVNVSTSNKKQFNQK